MHVFVGLCSANRQWIATADSGADSTLVVWDSKAKIAVRTYFDTDVCHATTTTTTPHQLPPHCVFVCLHVMSVVFIGSFLYSRDTAVIYCWQQCLMIYSGLNYWLVYC